MVSVRTRSLPVLVVLVRLPLVASAARSSLDIGISGPNSTRPTVIFRFFPIFRCLHFFNALGSPLHQGRQGDRPATRPAVFKGSPARGLSQFDTLQLESR